MTTSDEVRARVIGDEVGVQASSACRQLLTVLGQALWP